MKISSSGWIAVILWLAVPLTVFANPPAMSAESSDVPITDPELAKNSNASKEPASVLSTQEVPVDTPDNATTNVLPNPLTLEQALALADETHPDLLLAQSSVESARAELLRAESETGINSFVDVTARTMKLSTTGEEVDDSYARLVLNKTLYDFGRSSSLEASKTAYLNSSEYQAGYVRLQYQYEIMQRFLDVLLTDFRYNVDDEEMTQRFLKFDKLRERHSLGMVSDVELRKAESEYRSALDTRVASDKNRRSARLMLAVALNRPLELPDDLVMPDLNYINAELPDAMELYKEALANNRTILALQEDVESARNRIQSERARAYPTISAELEVGEYERPTTSRGDYSAALTLRVPIYQGGVKKAEIARATADLSLKSARLKKAEQELLVSILRLVKELDILKTKRETSKQHVNYRDLDLDYKRALYEMEVLSTLSDAQARLTEVLWNAMKNDFDTALKWAQINMLLGKSPNASIPQPSKSEPEEALP